MDQTNQNSNSQKRVVINGKELPFTTEEFKRLLNVMKSALAEGFEIVEKEDEGKKMENLITEIDKL